MGDRAKPLEEPAAAGRAARKPAPVPAAGVSAALPGMRGARVPPSPGGAADVLAMQRMVGNRAVARMLDASVQRAEERPGEPSDDAVRAAAAEGVATPSVALPFLGRIQESFGRHAIGHVQAHVGAPATEAAHAMGARAYATGAHVVFAGTPELRTAAHEAAHVVQQEGGVQLAGGIGREGDAYERHADAVADAVVAGRSAEQLLESVRGGGGAIQRDSLIVNRRDDQLDAFIDDLETIVAHYANAILTHPLVAEIDGYTRRWNAVYQRFRDGYHDPFLYSAYGYAIESYTLKDLPPLPPGLVQQGWSVHSQVTRGMTRPDIVVMDGDMTEQAWIDITSSASSGHIGNKTGSGWETRPYVCEILYPSLDPDELGVAEMTPEEKERHEGDIANLKMESAARAVLISRALPDVDGIYDKRAKRTLCETALGDLFELGGKLTPNATKSVLVFVEQWTAEANLLTRFGYTGGDHQGRDRQTADLLINGLDTYESDAVAFGARTE
jgi:Domain of unknown function (DUF4157)